MVDGSYIITNAGEWAWLGGKNIVNSITLKNDIDFGGYSVQNIAIGIPGKGTPGLDTLIVDGQGHTLSNLSTSAFYATTPVYTSVYGDYVSGLFSCGSGVTYVVKDLKVDHIQVDCPHTDNYNNIQGYAAAVFGEVSRGSNLTVTNVHVSHATVKGILAVAGLIGHAADESTIKVTNCSVTDSQISNYSVKDESGFVCGFIGRQYGKATLTDCQISNVTVDGYYDTKSTRGENSIQPIFAMDKNRVPASCTDTLRISYDNITVTKTVVK